MKTIVKVISLLLIATLAACSERESASLNSVDVKQADSIAPQPTLNVITSCATCHGENGISVNPEWPNLAGQQEEYLYQQLLMFRDGKRQNTVMSGALLSSLGDAKLRRLAQHYSQMDEPVVPASNINDLPGAHVRAHCVSCHAMDGKSVTSLWPNLSGQNQGYLAKQLRDYKTGKRKHPIMQVIANELSEQQIDDVAEYFSKQ